MVRLALRGAGRSATVSTSCGATGRSAARPTWIASLRFQMKCYRENEPEFGTFWLPRGWHIQSEVRMARRKLSLPVRDRIETNCSISSHTPVPWPDAVVKVARVLHRLQRIRHGDGAATDFQESMIIFGVTDTHDRREWKRQFLERRAQTAGLVHSVRQDHDRTFVQDDLEIQSQLRDRLPNDRLGPAPASPQ